MTAAVDRCDAMHFLGRKLCKTMSGVNHFQRGFQRFDSSFNNCSMSFSHQHT